MSAKKGSSLLNGCVFFGEKIDFDAAEIRYMDLFNMVPDAIHSVEKPFYEWYEKRGDIEEVLNQYKAFAQKTLSSYAIRALFPQLSENEIYDISENTYVRECVALSDSDQAFRDVRKTYQQILQKQQEAEEYREIRKDSRGRWQGGGFGLGGAIKGATQAAAMNAVSGLGHSLVNAVGNAGSSMAASSSKRELYKRAKDSLLIGIQRDMANLFVSHIELLNQYEEELVTNSFDKDKSNALFENAKKLPDKRDPLLQQAFLECPWNEPLIKYLFANCPEGRSAAVTAAQVFSIDLRDQMETLLSYEYTEKDKSSEAAERKAQKRILSLMKKYGITESKTLDALEKNLLNRVCEGYKAADESTCEAMKTAVASYDVQEKLKPAFLSALSTRIEEIWNTELAQICQGYETADEKTCKEMIDAINAHHAGDNFKTPFLEKLHERIKKIWDEELARICQGYETADEKSCNEMINAVNAHHAAEEHKAAFLKKIQARIETIWSAEDGEIFDNLYLQTDITDPKAVAEAIAYIEEKSRTASSEKYLKALKKCSPEEIKRARQYKYSIRPKLYPILAVLCGGSFIFGAALAVIGVPLAILFLWLRFRIKAAWNDLTLNGSVIPLALSENIPRSPQKAIEAKDDHDGDRPSSYYERYRGGKDRKTPGKK